MYLPIEPQPSCAQAWLAATQTVNAQRGHQANNVIIDVADPIAESPTDKEIRLLVDGVLRRNGCWPIKTVANTIFPDALYARHGSPKFYDVYMEKVFPRIKKSQGDWGRYFERMMSFPLPKKGKPINPLRDLVEKMREHVEGDRCFRNVYELTIYDPVRDAAPVRNRQCLSFLSFKIVDGSPRQLLLTAMYRNHYYIERLLGNLIGLARLMHFVAEETGVGVGSLTVVSTHAEIDSDAARPSIESLLKSCESLVAAARKP